MHYKNLGRTGLKVSAVGLGCGNFGGIGSAPAFFGRGESEQEAGAIMDAAWEQATTRPHVALGLGSLLARPSAT